MGTKNHRTLKYAIEDYLARRAAEKASDPLVTAAAAGDLSQVEALLDAGHDVNAKAGDGPTALSLGPETK